MARSTAFDHFYLMVFDEKSYYLLEHLHCVKFWVWDKALKKKKRVSFDSQLYSTVFLTLDTVKVDHMLV